jgi:chromosome segregation ATPase
MYRRLNTVMDCVFDTQRSSDEVRLSIQEILDQEERRLRLTREVNQHRSKLMEKESQVIQQKKRIQSKLDTLKAKQQLLENRKIDIANGLGRCESGIENLHENEMILEKNVKMRQTTHHTLNRRKKELIADLFSIYPIEQVSFKLHCVIIGVPLFLI